MKRIAVVGATGYLGSFVCQALQEQSQTFRCLVRNKVKLLDKGINRAEVFEVDFTNPVTLKNSLQDVDVVISCLGLTRQKGELSHMDIDYQANLNVLNEAMASGVKKFIYVSVLRGNELRHLHICAAKEKFVDALLQSELEYTIIRPTGFFSDMGDFFKMAKYGRVFLFGKGEYVLNPIHGADLATAILASIEKNCKELNIGGPVTYSQNQIAELAFATLGKPVKVIYIPDVLRRVILKFAKYFLSEKNYSILQFFLNVTVFNMTAKAHGSRQLKDYFKTLTHNN